MYRAYDNILENKNKEKILKCKRKIYMRIIYCWPQNEMFGLWNPSRVQREKVL